jgi:hypothetical protein
MAASDKDIKAAIAEVIETAAPLSVVFPWWVLGHEMEEWPGILRSPDDNDRSHGWIITRRSNERTPGVGGTSDQRRLYHLWGFHYYETGNADLNTDDLFQAEIDAIGDALSDSDAITIIDYHEQLQVPFIGVIKAGSELLHMALCQLTVSVC